MHKRLLWVLLVGFLGGCVARPHGLPPGHGGVPPGHGGIPPGLAKKMGPPAIIVVGTPSLVIIPGTNISVVHGVDADLFVVRGVYYYYHDHVWYTGSHHRGPWKEIHHKNLPPGLREKSPRELKAMANGKGQGNRGKRGKW